MALGGDYLRAQETSTPPLLLPADAKRVTAPRRCSSTPQRSGVKLRARSRTRLSLMRALLERAKDSAG